LAYSDENKKPGNSEEKEILAKLEGNFESALNHPTWVSWRQNAVKCHDYKENRQWTSDELSELKKRGQPPTVNNQISVTVNRMVGQFVKQKTKLAFKGRNPDDKAGADVLSDLFLFIRQNNDLEYEEKEQAEDGFTAGFGVLKASVTYDDSFQPNIELKQVDSFTVLPDPYSRRYDWNQDANFICEAAWVDIEDACELYPDKKRQIKQIADSSATAGQLSQADRIRRDNYIDQDQKRVRIIEQWYKTKRKQSVCVFQDGTVYDKETGELSSPMSPNPRSKWSTERWPSCPAR